MKAMRQEDLMWPKRKQRMMGMRTKTIAPEEFYLHRLLGVILSDKLDAGKKKHILETEFHIPMTETIDRRLDEMCNLSEGIYQKGIAEGISQGISQGESLLASLMERLFADGRTADANKAAVDEETRRELYREYGLMD